MTNPNNPIEEMMKNKISQMTPEQLAAYEAAQTAAIANSKMAEEKRMLDSKPEMPATAVSAVPSEEDFKQAQKQHNQFIEDASKVNLNSEIVQPEDAAKLPESIVNSLLDYEKNMEEDFNESAEVRLKLKENGVANGMAEYIDPSKEEKLPEELKNIIDEEAEAEEAEEELTDEERQKEFLASYEKNATIIQKFGAGVIEFSDEEREKLKRSKMIKLQDVEVVDIASLQRRRARTTSVDEVIKLNTKKFTVPVPLQASGFQVRVSGLSTYEIMNLVEQGQGDPVAQSQLKWSIIHEHIEETSIGKLSFKEFMNVVAQSDYDMLVYGVLCATYPDNGQIELSCPKCKTEYDFEYSIASLLRAEKFSPELFNRIAEIIDAAPFEERAKAIQAQSIMQQSTTYRLPESGYVVTIGSQSANDFINDTVRGINEIDDARYNQAALLTTAIHSVYVPVGENHVEYTDFASIVRLVYSLGDTDVVILGELITKILDTENVQFGLMDITCPKCKSYTDVVEIGVDEILFRRYQAAITTEVEN